MAYSTEFDKSAAKYIKALDSTNRTRMKEKLEKIQADPFDLTHSKPLTNRTERSARIGDYRILFEVDEKAEKIFIVRVGPRGDIYKD